MMSAVLSNPNHPEYGVATIPFPIPHDQYTYCMDSANLRNMHRICGGDFASKLRLLMDYTDRPGDVADPWYTEDFEATWQDVLEGCQGLLKELLQERGEQNGAE